MAGSSWALSDSLLCRLKILLQNERQSRMISYYSHNAQIHKYTNWTSQTDKTSPGIASKFQYFRGQMPTTELHESTSWPPGNKPEIPLAINYEWRATNKGCLCPLNQWSFLIVTILCLHTWRYKAFQASTMYLAVDFFSAFPLTPSSWSSSAHRGGLHTCRSHTA